MNVKEHEMNALAEEIWVPSAVWDEIIRGDTPHFEYVSGEAASGLQQAALLSGVHVAFGVWLEIDLLDRHSSEGEATPLAGRSG